MALINCPECKKEISDSIGQCIHCGYVIEKENVIAIKRYSYRVPLIGSAIMLLSIFIYNNSFIWYWYSTLPFISSILIVALFGIGKKYLSHKAIEVIFSLLFLFSSFFIIFNHNLSRIDLSFINGIFDPYLYESSFGIVLMIYQIIACISVILVSLVGLMDRVSYKIKIALMIIVAMISAICFFYKIVYIQANVSIYTLYLWWILVCVAFYSQSAVYYMAKGKIGFVE